MRMTKLGSVLGSLTIAATGAVVLLGTAPAQAETSTQVTLSMTGSTRVIEHYQTYIGPLTVQLTAADATTITAGQSVLQRHLPGKSWKTVRTDANAGNGVSFGSYGSKALGNVQYRVLYQGGTDGTSTWASATSNVVTVYTGWNLNEKGTCTAHTCHFSGKLAPRSQHHKMVIQVRSHGKWKTYKRIKTDGRSHWTAVVAPSRGKGTFYRAVATRSKSFVTTYSGVWQFVKHSRTADRRVTGVQAVTR